MSDTAIAKPFRNGRSQAVRLPREFPFKGDRVRVHAVPGGVLLEPLFTDTEEWFRELVRLSVGRFMPGGRQGRRQPPRPTVIAAYELWYGVGKSAKPEANTQCLAAFLARPVALLAFDYDDANRRDAPRSARGRRAAHRRV